MSDISDLERRITSALDRATKALEQLSVASEESGPDLSAELEAERVANRQLEERVRAIKEKQENTVTALEREVADLKDALATRDADVQQMRAVNASLRETNTALRDANAKGLPEPKLIDQSMSSELESLRAARAAQQAEIEEILATLEPVLKEA
ncbi:MAG: hypothetical protein HKN27_05725 [Silicimonas sp.]|nr:hypothetical protein [Silicimonas sp.]